MSDAAPAVALDHLTAWAAPLRRCCGDQRTAALLVGMVAGILGSGSLVGTRIAAFPPSAGALPTRRPPNPAHADR